MLVTHYWLNWRFCGFGLVVFYRQTDHQVTHRITTGSRRNKDTNSNDALADGPTTTAPGPKDGSQSEEAVRKPLNTSRKSEPRGKNPHWGADSLMGSNVHRSQWGRGANAAPRNPTLRPEEVYRFYSWASNTGVMSPNASAPICMKPRLRCPSWGSQEWKWVRSRWLYLLCDICKARVDYVHMQR